MKKFSSFGSFLGRIPTISPQNATTDYDNNNPFLSETNSENSAKSNDSTQASDFAKTDFDTNSQVMPNLEATYENQQTQQPEYFHYPQSNYDPLQAHENNFYQNKTSENQNAQTKPNSNSNQNEQNILSQKAKTLWECMRQHDNIVRNMK